MDANMPFGLPEFSDELKEALRHSTKYLEETIKRVSQAFLKGIETLYRYFCIDTALPVSKALRYLDYRYFMYFYPQMSTSLSIEVKTADKREYSEKKCKISAENIFRAKIVEKLDFQEKKVTIPKKSVKFPKF